MLLASKIDQAKVLDPQPRPLVEELECFIRLAGERVQGPFDVSPH